MATIRSGAGDSIFTISKWLGLQEGETTKPGEAVSMKNFAISTDYELTTRPGQETVCAFSSPILGLWAGLIHGNEVMLAVSGGKLYALDSSFAKTEVGSVEGRVSFFPFGDKVYLLNGTNYKVYDGTTLSDVEGYIPLVVTEMLADGSGNTMEQVNKLSNKRRVWLSPDGTASSFKLPEPGTVISVTDRNTGDTVSVTQSGNSVVFASPPAAAVDSLEVLYSVEADFSGQIQGMRFAELYNGNSDARVWVYGDGSNKAYYSGIDQDGSPRADYFPDMNEMAVGEASTPITAMIRLYGNLIAYKTDSTYSIDADFTTADGMTIPVYYIRNVNKSVGNLAPGQVQLVNNAPRSLHRHTAYDWKSNKSGNLTMDERQATRVSDRVHKTLSGFDLTEARCWDDNNNHEYYICCNRTALVHNYALDVWYYYTNMDAQFFGSYGGRMYFAGADGKIRRFSAVVATDDGEEIEASWESCDMDFGRDHQRKFTSSAWAVIRPEADSKLFIAEMTERDGEKTFREVGNAVRGFPLDFPTWNFSTKLANVTTKLRIRKKKFVFWKLFITSGGIGTRGTVASVSVKIRMAGYAK